MGSVEPRARGRAILRGVAVALVAVAATVGAAALQPAAHGAARVTKAATPGTVEALTKWRKVGYWAHAAVAIPVHKEPTTASPTVTKLHSKTEDGYPEVYLVLARQVMDDGRTWLKIALPMRPNGETGWVVKGALGRVKHVAAWLVIDRAKLRATFFQRGRKLWSARVGIGKASTPTPTGLYWVREQFELKNQPFYGPYAFGTSAYANVSDWPGGGVVGLHGTSLPQLIPGRPSHGCVRFRNKDIVWLAYHMPTGTPISVIH
jgi:hypothetical protein